jgi:NADH:ubiquinone oxidoreductase subunit 2 (subunit N)
MAGVSGLSHKDNSYFEKAKTVFFTACYASIAVGVSAVALKALLHLVEVFAYLTILSLATYGLAGIKAQIDGRSLEAVVKEASEFIFYPLDLLFQGNLPQQAPGGIEGH